MGRGLRSSSELENQLDVSVNGGLFSPCEVLLQSAHGMDQARAELSEIVDEGQKNKFGSYSPFFCLADHLHGQGLVAIHTAPLFFCRNV